MPSLVIATEEQKLARDPIAYVPWGARLTLDQWFLREAELRAHPWSQESMITWLWQAEDGVILASCESFATPSQLHGEAGQSFSIASVLTEPALRGKGHATALMTALVARLRDFPQAHAVTLYSDVGAPIYARSGYVATPAVDWSILPAAGDPATAVDALLTDLAAPPLPTDPYHFRPSLSQLDWHVLRERLYRRFLGPPTLLHSRFFDSPTLPWRGARAGGGMALWVASRKSNELLVLTLDGNQDEITALLESARRLAHQENLARVMVWEDDHLAGLLPAFATREPRDGGLPMLCPLDPRAAASLWRHRPRALWV